jgi:hypothetical protein
MIKSVYKFGDVWILFSISQLVFFYSNKHFFYILFNKLKHYIKKESPNTYKDIDTTIKEITKNKITMEHLTNYLKHSYKIYKS